MVFNVEQKKEGRMIRDLNKMLCINLDNSSLNSRN